MTNQRKFQMAVLVFVPTLIIVAAYFLFTIDAPKAEISEIVEVQTDSNEESLPFIQTHTVGASVEGRDIDVVTYGDGETSLLFVGGIHGGYEWNSSLLAFSMIEYFAEHPEVIPDDITVSIIPVLNPDGLYKVTGKEGVFVATDIQNPSTRVAEGRFNARGVDLNRNFDCKWAPESTWRGKTVSAGSEAFSEPEAKALRNYIGRIRPEGVIFWHSKANNVYASECEEGILPLTLDVMNVYADAAQYGKVEKFDAYPITGDAEGWLASIGIPAVTVELESASSIEWERNLAGVEAVLGLFSEAQ